MQLTNVTGTAHDGEGNLLPRARCVVRVVSVSGVLVSSNPVEHPADSDALFDFNVPRNSTVRIESEMAGYNVAGGVEVVIPDSAETTLEELLPSADAPSTAVTQYAFDTYAAAQAARDAVYVVTVDEDTVLDIGTALRALILVDTTAGDVTVQLQPLAEMTGREIVFVKIADDNLAIVDGDASELINGALVFNLETLNQFIGVMAGAGQWRIVRR
jgi:hypothetical protein